MPSSTEASPSGTSYASAAHPGEHRSVAPPVFHVRAWNGSWLVEAADQLVGGIFSSPHAARTFVIRATIGRGNAAVIEWTDGTREHVRFGEH
jgi:hypothetical protein